jgi:hypothetical protein
MTTSTTTVQVLDTPVRPRSPLAAATWCVLTAGISGAVRIGRLNGDLRRLGRARGAMPFAFIRVHPALSVLAWLMGIMAWVIVLASLIVYVHALVTNTRDASVTDLPSIALLGVLLLPLWLTVFHTGSRISTAQHLVGQLPDPSLPRTGALLAVTFPPAATWYLQRAANQAWNTWRQP